MTAMTAPKDRVGQLLEGIRREHRELVTPEGVPLEIRIAGNGERISALMLDLGLMLVIVILLYFLLFFLWFSGATRDLIGWTVVELLVFVVRNYYFIHFELAWQGRTPGKKACGLRVVNRAGGELTPGAVIARNLTREVEIFLPLTLWLLVGFEGTWQNLTLLGWVMLVATMPLWNKGRLRAGDLIGGTQVISMPKRLLLGDLSAEGAEATAPRKYNFRPEQLAVYGAFELQVLEELLRRPGGPAAQKLLEDVSLKIRQKIGWDEALDPRDTRRFLTDFYAAERAELERGQLFGRLKADKDDQGPKPPTAPGAAGPAQSKTRPRRPRGNPSSIVRRSK